MRTPVSTGSWPGRLTAVGQKAAASLVLFIAVVALTSCTPSGQIDARAACTESLDVVETIDARIASVGDSAEPDDVQARLDEVESSIALLQGIAEKSSDRAVAEAVGEVSDSYRTFLTAWLLEIDSGEVGATVEPSADMELSQESYFELCIPISNE